MCILYMSVQVDAGCWILDVCIFNGLKSTWVWGWSRDAWIAVSCIQLWLDMKKFDNTKVASFQFDFSPAMHFIINDFSKPYSMYDVYKLYSIHSIVYSHIDRWLLPNKIKWKRDGESLYFIFASLIIWRRFFNFETLVKTKCTQFDGASNTSKTESRGHRHSFVHLWDHKRTHFSTRFQCIDPVKIWKLHCIVPKNTKFAY